MLGSKFVKFLMSFLNWQANSCSNFALFFIFITYNSSVSSKRVHVLLKFKGFHQSPNFETLECYGENLSHSSCHFGKRKSVSLQILHQSSVPTNITPLDFVSSNIIYFGQRQPIKRQLFVIFECSGQNLLNFSCQF